MILVLSYKMFLNSKSFTFSKIFFNKTSIDFNKSIPRQLNANYTINPPSVFISLFPQN